jgi:hypothetical protein
VIVRAAIPLIALLVLNACSSSSSFEKQTIEGGPGQPILVELASATMPMASVGTMLQFSDQQAIFQFEISNDSDRDVTVTSISMQQVGSGGSALQVDSASLRPNQTIAPGKDWTAEIRTRGRQVHPLRRNEAPVIIIHVAVGLDNGDTYVYSFEVPMEGVQ